MTPAVTARRTAPTLHLTCLALLILTALLLTACGDRAPTRSAALPVDATVLVVGDSLVAGTGASRAQSWPAVLAGITGWSVINAGVPGHTSTDARGRLDDLLAEHQPDAVIIAIGGNDFLRRVDQDTTHANIAAMLATSKAAASHVALVAIPEPSMGGQMLGRLSDHTLYERLAAEHAVTLVAGVLSPTLSREIYRADRIHANADGYAYMADQIAGALTEAGWLNR